MGPVFGWMMVCLLLAIPPLAAQETSSDQAVHERPIELDAPLDTPPQTSVTGAGEYGDAASSAPQGREPVTSNAAWGGAFQPAVSQDEPTVDTVSAAGPRTRLVDVLPAPPQGVSGAAVESGPEQDLLEEFLEAYDRHFSEAAEVPGVASQKDLPMTAAGPISSDQPVVRTAANVPEKPSMKLQFNGPNRHLIERAPPVELIGAIESPPALGLFAPEQLQRSMVEGGQPTPEAGSVFPPVVDEANTTALDSAVLLAEGVSEQVHIGGRQAGQTNSGQSRGHSGGEEVYQPIQVTAELPIRHFPIEPLVQPVVAKESATANGHVIEAARGESPAETVRGVDRFSVASLKAVPTSQPIVSIGQPLDPTVLPELDRGDLVAQLPTDGSVGSSNPKSLVAVATIDISTRNASSVRPDVVPVKTAPPQELDRNSTESQLAPGPSSDLKEPVPPLPGEAGVAGLSGLDSELTVANSRDGSAGCQTGWNGFRRPEIYYSVFGGAASVIDLVDQGAYIENPPFQEYELETTYELEDSFAFGFAVGQIRGPHLRTEIELAFRSNRALELTLSQPQSSAQFPLQGKLDSFAGMANAYWEFVGFPMRDIKPYVGGGVGFSLFQSDFLYAGQPVVDARFETDSAVAYQGMAGLNWCTGPGTSLFLEYRYFGSSPLVTKVEALVNRFEYRTDNIFVGVRFKF